MTEVIAALIQALPATIVGFLGYIITKQSLENSWRQTLDSIGREFWSNPDIKRIRCAVSYPKAYVELQFVLKKRNQLDSEKKKTINKGTELDQAEYELLDDLDRFLTLLESAALSSPILRDKATVWNALYFDYWLQKCMEKPEMRWYVENYFPRLSMFYFKQTKGK